ncbi:MULTISPECIES: flagellar basal body P-ring protein FlgI [unclassified Helicobacter]|uniref:flagellar basal body P-ring protein FlgI n=1 Tax=unclassified Helicobacter TaxID=2593540 RepID=UPI000ACDBDD1
MKARMQEILYKMRAKIAAVKTKKISAKAPALAKLAQKVCGLQICAPQSAKAPKTATKPKTSARIYVPIRAFAPLIAICLAIHAALPQAASAEKIGDIANIVGVRGNQLIGYGLVIGLNGSGDKTSSKFTMQSIANMLESVNVKVDPESIKSKNVAAVLVTANLPPFARQGDKLDVQISSIGDAKSLESGILVMTPLSAVDGNIYAIAQGAVTTGNSSNVLNASVAGGAVVEREVAYNLSNQQEMTLSLKNSNFQNALKVQEVLNLTFGKDSAVAIDSRTIKLSKPENLTPVEFVALLQEVQIDYTMSNKIIIDEKSGTIVAGIDIPVRPVVVTSGDITLKITNEPINEKGAQQLDATTSFDQGNGTISASERTTTISSVVKALQKMGASPKSMISILEAMRQSGAFSTPIEIL